MSADQGMGWGAHVHVGVVKREVFEVHEFALKPIGGATFAEVGPGDPPSRTGLLAKHSSRRASASSPWLI